MAALAEAAGVGVDTVRFYQARGLIPPPARRGRFAIYSTEHLERIRRIRSLLDAGFSLAQIRRLLDTEPEAVAAPAAGVGRSRRRGASADRTEETTLLAALAAQRVGEGTLGRAELAAASGIPEALVAAAVQAGLIAPIEIHGEERFPRSDLELLQAALELLGLGLPLDRLLELAAQHAAQVDHLADQAIELFDDHVRKPRGADEDAVRRSFERLLPRATRIVALHFQRTVVARALERLRDRGEARALEKALEATQAARLEVQWR
ncbi:MAG: MerR family transcriptional regulator [Myxococcota bacterium]|nr:MerR family transcriptional regulator [Myxococcales bacterium]